LRYFSSSTRPAVLIRAVLLIALIALIDWKVETNVSLGFLYLFPMLMVGAHLPRWQIAIVAGLCTALVEWFDPFTFVASEGIPRVIMVFAAFFGAGLFVFESTRRRQLALQHLQDIEKEMDLRRDAEEQLKVLVESSPAAIFTCDGAGRILLANKAAHDLLGFDTASVIGERIANYLPALGNVPALTDRSPLFRTEVECRGHRRNGDVFLSNAWFSTYRTRSGPRLAAVVIDVSQDLRDREESSLQQFMAGSRIVVATVCHEIRNLCGAIAVVHANLGRNRFFAENEDYRALSTLVEGLEKIASLELRQSSAESMHGVDLGSVLDELRIVIEPALRDSGIEVEWRVPIQLPQVWAEAQVLLQVFLNLIKNSTRALESSADKRLTITASNEAGRVLVRVEDTGPGVAAPDRLFRPFQSGAESTGLGLYISRALVRGFRGDLGYEPRPHGSCFTITLAVVERELEPLNVEERASASASAGRSYPVSREPEPSPGRRT
jgi:two-component system, LuxR family, sensor kinase FixL